MIKCSLYSMEPMLPNEGDVMLEDLALNLTAKAMSLASKINPHIKDAIGDLVRSMNCYYSNLIEGHNTHPVDIEKALSGNYSNNIEKRNLQLEAKAHISVQKSIDEKDFTDINILASDFITSIHKEFYELLPEEFKLVTNPSTGKSKQIRGGEFRDGDVQVGQHIAPSFAQLPLFMQRFTEAYDKSKLSKLRSIIAVAASHHRFTWIHPFYDGNGRVVRLLSHAHLKSLAIGNSLWSVSRGLARRNQEYKLLLMAADQPRKNDLDGRGNLSEQALRDFCIFFLETCIDQIDFMDSLLEINSLLARIEAHINEEISAGILARGSFALIRELFFRGEIDRGEVASITAYRDRQSRTIITKLFAYGLLESPSPRGHLHIKFPVKVLDKWFPKLYPVV